MTTNGTSRAGGAEGESRTTRRTNSVGTRREEKQEDGQEERRGEEKRNLSGLREREDGQKRGGRWRDGHNQSFAA